MTNVPVVNPTLCTHTLLAARQAGESTIRFKMIPTDLNHFGIHLTITVTAPLPSLILWELITHYQYRLRNSRDLLS